VARHCHANAQRAPPLSSAQLLNQLIREQVQGGDFATAIVRVTDIAEIHCGFAAEAGADRLASLVDAYAPHPPEAGASGWSSYRTFRLGTSREVALAGWLLAQRRRIFSPAAADHTQLGR
jgi:hypothetical protein